ncbi:MAG: RagB/SusD family nutrient uptake outer membrane protein, partial [Bacteroidetes bacterium]|nr:RagB/SusD family nutrient uptake outer membrane protein [Bacteroidota bacterium]
MRLSIYTFLFFAGIVLAGCSKDALTTPASKNVLAPQTLTQLEGLLNDVNLFSKTPVMGEQSADSYQLTDPSSPSLSAMDLNLYVWRADIYGGVTGTDDWNIPYRQIAVCNEVLQDLNGITRSPENTDRWDAVSGKARFLRSYAFLQLLMLYSPAYTPANADLAQGIPLPLKPDLHAVYSRATLRECYAQITDDFRKATGLLQARGVDSSFPKPDKAAACAMLARTWHMMGDYVNAKQWADSALFYAPPLVSYKDIGTTGLPAKLATEVLYASNLMTSNVLQAGLPVCIIDPSLYQLYEDSDRRKTLYFKPNPVTGQPAYKNCYSSGFLPFSGLGLDEVYLIRAECYAQTGNAGQCLADLNTL